MDGNAAVRFGAIAPGLRQCQSAGADQLGVLVGYRETGAEDEGVDVVVQPSTVRMPDVVTASIGDATSRVACGGNAWPAGWAGRPGAAGAGKP